MLDREGGYWTIIPNRERHAYRIGDVPAGSREITVVTIGKDGSEGASYPLGADSADLGREEGAIVLREDAYISPRHLRLYARDGVWYARDLGSLNGFYIRLRQPRVLIRKTRFVFDPPRKRTRRDA